MLFAISHFILVSKINDKVTNNYFPEKKKKEQRRKNNRKTKTDIYLVKCICIFARQRPFSQFAM